MSHTHPLIHCVKRIQIRRTERYFVSLRIQSDVGKYGPEKTPYLDTFHAVILFVSPLVLCEAFEKVKKHYLLAINGINGNFLCAVPVQIKFPIFRDVDDDIIKNFATMTTIAVVNNRT